MFLIRNLIKKRPHLSDLFFWEFRWNQKKRKVNERKIKENKRKIKGIRKHKKGNGRKSKENGKEIKGKIKDLKGKLKKMKGKMKGDGCCEIIFPEKKINKRKTKISNNAPETKINSQPNSSKVEWSSRRPPG